MNISVIIEKLSNDELIRLKKIIDICLDIREREARMAEEAKEKNGGIFIPYLDISNRALNACAANNITTLEQLAEMGMDEFMKHKNVGKLTCKEMTEELLRHGLSWKCGLSFKGII